MSKRSAAYDFLAGGGECGALIRAKDWSQTPLGPVEQWPQSLKTAVRIILTSRQPMFVWWGKQLINLYNDAYCDIVGGKHPKAQGQPASEVWHEIWHQVEPRARKAIGENVGTYDEALLMIMERHGYPEETYYTFSYSPIPGDSGKAEGIICANSDETGAIIGERQLTTLKELAAQTGKARTAADACRLSAKALAVNTHDVPFAALYLQQDQSDTLTLQAAVGIARNHRAVSKKVGVTDERPWPFSQVLSSGKPVVVNDLDQLFDKLPTGAWERPPSQAVLLPLGRLGASASGVLLVALNPFRPYDGSYEQFIELVASEISASLDNAEAYNNERNRADELAELDRTKTSFFNNVSHELRTPLTLILGPLDDLLHRPQQLAPSPQIVEQLDVAYRNGLRLQKLVNTLLDFSRIEAGRVQALYLPTDLVMLTTDLASNFRTAIERAGMKLELDVHPLDQPVYVDREMWEKIVLNLLSNAFKYTLKGSITVKLRQVGNSVVLGISDSGIGIKPDELPHLFERFHRVQGVQSRTHEGTGIGLALVRELVKQHGGTIKVDSVFGQGTTFTVSIPTGFKHLPQAHVTHEQKSVTTLLDEQYVQEALRWLRPAGDDAETASAGEDKRTATRQEPAARIVLVDDNADMRSYVSHLLKPFYQVTTHNSGQAALRAIRKHPPDLVITDVMMPELDGVGLLQALRKDPATGTLPVIMLSAQTGEEARIEGMDAGADDYLVKPFAARELIARVRARLDMANMRREAAKQVLAERQRLRDLFLHAPAAVAIISGPDLRFELANSSFRKLLGADRNLDGLPLMEAMPDLEPAIHDIVKDVAFKGNRFVANELAMHLDWDNTGKLYTKYLNLIYEPLIENNKPNGLTAFVYEVTDQVVARKKAEESERRFRFMAESMPQMVFTVQPDAIIDYFNPQWAAYTGISIKHLLHVADLRDKVIHPDDLLGVIKVWRKSFSKGQPLEYECRLRRKDGKFRWHINRVHPMKDENGDITIWIGSSTDIDDIRRATERRHELEIKTATLTEQRTQLLALNQAKDEFISLASHQLRTPATGVKQYLGMLLQGYAGPLTSDQKAFLETAYESNERQITIVNDLLRVARIDAGKVTLQREKSDLVRLVKNVINEQASKFDDRDQKIVLRVKHNTVKAHVDADRIRMVLDNIVDNASKYTEPGKTITVTVDKKDSKVLVSVADQGVGMAKKDIKRIFQKFSRLEDPLAKGVEGSGLGLYWAQKIVSLHQGKINVRSRVGKGTTFIVSLPM
jgi:PAS domain S-box-containing protein